MAIMNNLLHQPTRKAALVRKRVAALMVCLSTVVPRAASAQPDPGAQTPGPNTLELLASRAGAKTCLNAARALSPAFTGPSAGHAALPMQHPGAQDKSLFSAMVEQQHPEGPRLASTWFTPNGQGNCDVGYELISVWQKSCLAVAEQDLKLAKPMNAVARDVIVAVVKPTHHIYLLSTPGGCVSVNKEVLYP